MEIHTIGAGVKAVRYTTNKKILGFNANATFIEIVFDNNAYQTPNSSTIYDYIRLVDKNGNVIPTKAEWDANGQPNGGSYFQVITLNNCADTWILNWVSSTGGVLADAMGSFNTAQVGAYVTIKSGFTRSVFTHEESATFTMGAGATKHSETDTTFGGEMLDFYYLTENSGLGTISANDTSNQKYEVTQSHTITGVQASNSQTCITSSGNTLVAKPSLTTTNLTITAEGVGTSYVYVSAKYCMPIKIKVTNTLGTAIISDPLDGGTSFIVNTGEKYDLSFKSNYGQTYQSYSCSGGTPAIIQGVAYVNGSTSDNVNTGLLRITPTNTVYADDTWTNITFKTKGCSDVTFKVSIRSGKIWIGNVNTTETAVTVVKGNEIKVECNLTNMQSISATSKNTAYATVTTSATTGNVTAQGAGRSCIVTITGIKGTYNLTNGIIEIQVSAPYCHKATIKVTVLDEIVLTSGSTSIAQGKNMPITATNQVGTPIKLSITNGSDYGELIGDAGRTLFGKLTGGGEVELTATANGCQKATLTVMVLANSVYNQYKIVYSDNTYAYFNAMSDAVNGGIGKAMEVNANGSLAGFTLPDDYQITVKANKTLTLTSAMAIPDGTTLTLKGDGIVTAGASMASAIDVKSGGKLVAENVTVTNSYGKAVQTVENTTVSLTGVTLTGRNGLDVAYNTKSATGANVTISGSTITGTTGAAIVMSSKNNLTNRSKVVIENTNLTSVGGKDIDNTARCYDIAVTGNGVYTNDDVAQWLGQYSLKKVNGNYKIGAKGTVVNVSFKMTDYCVEDKTYLAIYITPKLNGYTTSLKVTNDVGTVVASVDDITTLSMDAMGRYVYVLTIDTVHYCDKLTYEFISANAENTYVSALNYSVVDFATRMYDKVSNDLKTRIDEMLADCNTEKVDESYRTDVVAPTLKGEN